MLAAFKDFTKDCKQNERRTKTSTSDNELSLTYRITSLHLEENLSLCVASERVNGDPQMPRAHFFGTVRSENTTKNGSNKGKNKRKYAIMAEI